MSNEAQKPVVFIAFANEQPNTPGHLRNLGEEARRLSETLKKAEEDGLCELVDRPFATLDDILDVFQNARYNNRIAVFHYGGHASNFQLLLEGAEGTVAADAGGLATFLGQQRGIQLVFLNGCSTQPQVQRLLAANIPAVIATSQAIRDEIATNFASRFYRSLAGGANLRTAFNEAEASVQSSVGQDKTRDAYLEEHEPLDERWPWDLYLKPGAEQVAAWNFPEAVDNPLFGLPPLPELDLPDNPYRHLHYFAREHADVFFGRGYQIRALYERVTAPRTAPIILLYGQSGVGKSSILAAGLLPRLENNHWICYLRRDLDLGLRGTLRTALHCSERQSLREAWLALETQQEKPVVIVLDQVEEAYTRPNTTQPNEWAGFLEGLVEVFAEVEHRPRGKLILSFRKEWLADIETHLANYQLARTKVFIERLGRKGIVQAIVSPARVNHLQKHYGLKVDPELPGIIADDLLEDNGSPIAPTLQILLTKMWTEASTRNGSDPHFNVSVYQSLKKQGILLEDYLHQQFEALRQWQPSVETSGLALDLLAYHTTPLGTATRRTPEELKATYQDQADILLSSLVQQCKNLYLLVDPSQDDGEQTPATQLAHDTLAPLICREFNESTRPGQRARRILDHRSLDWRNGLTGQLLDEHDLIAVERGATGMRAWNEDELRLVQASREKYATSLRWRLTTAALKWAREGRPDPLLWTEEPDLLRLAPQLEINHHWFDALETEFVQSSIRQRYDILPPLTPENNPYRDLQAYQEPDHKHFFGRAKLTHRLLEQVQAKPLTVVVGPAGVGKSSLVLAGLVPQLRKTNPGKWHILPPIRPTITPLQTLQTFLMTHFADATLAPFTNAQTIGELDPVRTMGAWLEPYPEQKLLLIIDQFETLAHHCKNDRDRKDFIKCLAAGLQQYPEQLRLVLTIRIDSEAEFAGSPLQQWWTAARFRVPPMGRALLREAIEEPARVQGVYFEPDGLIDRLIDEAHQAEGHLPVLSMTLTALYLRSIERSVDDRAMKEEDYEALGGLTGVLTQQADAVYDKLDSAHQATLRRLVFRMASLEEGELVPRRVLRTELVYDDEAENQRVNTVIEQLGQARLITTGSLERGGDRHQPYIEPALPALINEWEKVAIWRQEESDALLSLQKRIIASTLEWQGASRSRELLWDKSTLLPQVEELIYPYQPKDLLRHIGDYFWSSPWQSSKPFWLNKQETRFIQQSIRAKRQARRMMVWSIGIILIALSFGIVRVNSERVNAENERNKAEQQRQEAVQQRREADSLRLALGAQTVNDPSLSLMLAREAVLATFTQDNHYAVNQAYAALQDTIGASHWRLTLEGHKGQVRSVAFSPDGTQIVTVGEDGKATVWDAASGDELLSLSKQKGQITFAAFSPDGTRIVTGGDGGAAKVWDAFSGEQQLTLTGHTGRIRFATFSPDGTRIVTGGDGGAVRVWETLSGEQQLTLTGHAGRIRFATFSPNGQQILTGGEDGTVKVWEAASGREKLSLTGEAGAIFAAIFSPDGTRILIAGENGAVKIWDAVSGEEQLSVTGPSDRVRAAAFSPDGKWIVTGSDNGMIRMRESAGGPQQWSLTGHKAPVVAVAFSPNDNSIATGGEDGTVKVWETTNGEEQLSFAGHDDWINFAAFSPDGRRIATASEDGTVKVWDASSGQELLPPLTGHQDRVRSVVFSSDGRQMVTASRDGTAKVWNTNGEELLTLRGHRKWIWSATFSPDGTQIVTAGGDKTAMVWDTASGTLPKVLTGHAGSVFSAVFSPDGTHILTGSQDGTAKLWNVSDKTVQRTLAGHTDWVRSAAFSPDGTRIVTASRDGTAKLWDTASGQELHTLTGHAGWPNYAAFSPDGKWLVTGGHDGLAKLWDTESGQEQLILTGHDDSIFSATFSPDGTRVVTASRDRTAKVWLMDVEALLCLAERRIERKPAHFSEQEQTRYKVGLQMSDNSLCQ